MVREALGLHIYGMETDHEEILAPSAFGTLRPQEGSAIVVVDVYMPALRERLNQLI